MTNPDASAPGAAADFIAWTDAMSVGNLRLDDQHKIIIECLNRLHPLLDLPNQQAEINTTIEKLEDFVLIHFSEEEQAMRLANFPNIREHQSQHDAMFELVFKMKTDIEHGRTVDARTLFGILNEWLVGHILSSDRDYIPYLGRPDGAPARVWRRSNGRPF